MAQPQPQVPHMQLPGMPMSQMPQMPQMPQQIQQQMPQMSPQLTPRPQFSPVQNSPSPVPQPSYPVPPHKRPRMSPGPGPQGSSSQPASQPTSPYLPTTSYAMSPPAQNGPPATSAHSPNYNMPVSAPPQNYSAPYTNGNTAPLPSPAPAPAPAPAQTASPLPLPIPTPQLHLPEARPAMAPTPASIRPATPGTPGTPILHIPQTQYTTTTPQPQYSPATMAPIPAPPPTNPGIMGPPSKPVEKPVKEYEYDISDSLAGTGVDLRAEEQYLQDFYAGSFTQDARSGLPGNPPGAKGSMYGAGLANQPPQPTEARTQEEYEAEVAKKAWEEAAQRLAILRSNEIRDPFLQVSVVHHKAEKIAKEYGLSLNLDLKNPNVMGKMKLPHDFLDKPTVRVQTKTYPGGAVVMTTGSWIPHDAYLADQLALLSIATKHRLRELVEEANTVAVTRQTTSHGEVPEEWADVAVAVKLGGDTEETPESAVSPQENPLKRSFIEASNEPAFSNKGGQSNGLNWALRDHSYADRQVEEARHRKRQKRKQPDAAPAGSRAGSVAPGTPTSVAPESDVKQPSKKELKKNAAASRLADAASTATASSTINTFLVGSFGKRKGKQYSWMKAGGSTPGTPGRMGSQGDSGAAASPGGAKASNKPASLTQEGKTRLGTWREDTEKGKNIQLRDWVTVLEMDGKESKALQDAYVKLDTSTPK